jgi:hypothetical protein
VIGVIVCRQPTLNWACFRDGACGMLALSTPDRSVSTKLVAAGLRMSLTMQDFTDDF